MKILRLVLASLIFMTFASCSSDDDNKELMSNYVTIKAEGSASITEDTDAMVSGVVTLSRKADKDVSFSLKIEGNDDGVVIVEPVNFNLKAGEKQTSFTVKSARKNLLTDDRNIIISLGETSDEILSQFEGGLTVVVNPAPHIAELTAEQKKFIAGYKEKFGFDAMKVMGRRNMETLVEFNNSDKDDFFKGENSKTFKGESVITLSSNATADKPVLKIVSNPMGMNEFFFAMLKAQTFEDKDYWLNEFNPYAVAVFEASQYDETKDKFTSSLDNIEVDMTNAESGVFTLSFARSTYFKPHDEEKFVVPFSFSFTAWDRVVKKCEEGVEVEIMEGETKVKKSLEELIYTEYGENMSATMNPNFWLINTGIDEDGWENEPSMYVQSKGRIDFKEGIMEFVFPWDFQNAGGYERIHSEYKIDK